MLHLSVTIFENGGYELLVIYSRAFHNIISDASLFPSICQISGFMIWHKLPSNFQLLLILHAILDSYISLDLLPLSRKAFVLVYF
jgi:hypothetical protein